MANATSTTTATTAAATGSVPNSGQISSAQKDKNLHTAAHLVAAQLGVDPISMNYDERLKYNRALALVIQKYPARFSDIAVQQANATLQKNYTPLDNTGFDLSAFGSAFADQAVAVGQKIADAANNGLAAVGNTFSLLKYVLPIIAVGGLALFVYLKAGGKRMV